MTSYQIRFIFNRVVRCTSEIQMDNFKNCTYYVNTNFEADWIDQTEFNLMSIKPPHFILKWDCRFRSSRIMYRVEWGIYTVRFNFLQILNDLTRILKTPVHLFRWFNFQDLTEIYGSSNQPARQAIILSLDI